MAWYNSDGLYIKFGTEEGVEGKAGEYVTTGPQRMVEVDITLTGLGTSAAIQDDHVVLPAGAFIEKVELINKVAATSGGSAVLNVGLQRTDRSTELDYDGFIAAGALSTYNAAGESVAYTEGSTGHGALIGTVLAHDGYITADYDTDSFTAGSVSVRIFYSF
jgi:hypothetical protein